ncbi:hypothetical protein BpHYR1_007547 [Brachionus plicatilis]|uniref:Uncharacterized protein n=1 Tax=Brachionus plicatilis TaxID=10195 RepID=A0A3M7S232_BRAPC|nr:hypothetical protein BpHYR1_007547 [Brachionus plicatilis]
MKKRVEVEKTSDSVVKRRRGRPAKFFKVLIEKNFRYFFNLFSGFANFYMTGQVWFTSQQQPIAYDDTRVLWLTQETVVVGS